VYRSRIGLERYRNSTGVHGYSSSTVVQRTRNNTGVQAFTGAEVIELHIVTGLI